MQRPCGGRVKEEHPGSHTSRKPAGGVREGSRGDSEPGGSCGPTGEGVNFILRGMKSLGEF